MNIKEKERLERLQRRLDWLHLRIYKSNEEKDLSFDKAEASALDWAIEIINKHFGVDK